MHDKNDEIAMKKFRETVKFEKGRYVGRFLWLKDCDVPSVDSTNVQKYRFCRVPFGIISNPFLLGTDCHLENWNFLRH